VADNPINIPGYWERPQHVADLWTLRKGRRKATCALFTHPIGREIRCDVSREMVKTEAKRDAMALIDLATEWKTQFQKKGWV